MAITDKFQAFDSFKTVAVTAVSVRNFAIGMIARLANDRPSNEIESVLDALINYRQALLAERDTPGLSELWQLLQNDSTLDAVAKINQIVSAIESTGQVIITLFPKDANGFWLSYTRTPQGVRQFRTFTAAQLTPLGTAFANLRDAV